MKIYTMTKCVYRIAYRVLRDAHPGPRATGRRGFSIAEVLLVAAIIAVLAGVGGGIWVGTYKKMLVERAARDFVLAAKYARITAIERQSPCRIVLDTEDNGFALAVYGLDEETGQTVQVPLRDSYFKRPVDFARGVEFEDIQIMPIGAEEMTEDDEEKTIVFLPNGTAQSAVIQIGNGKSRYTVSICAATGKAKVQSGTVEEVITATIDLDEEREGIGRSELEIRR